MISKATLSRFQMGRLEKKFILKEQINQHPYYLLLIHIMRDKFSKDS